MHHEALGDHIEDGLRDVKHLLLSYLNLIGLTLVISLPVISLILVVVLLSLVLLLVWLLLIIDLLSLFDRLLDLLR